jgi:PAS domain S-box-containing protein
MMVDYAASFIALLTPDGTVLEVNKRGLEVGNVHRDQVIGRPLWETPWLAQSKGRLNSLQDAINRATAGEVVLYETQLRLAPDHRLDIEVSLTPVRSEQGSVSFLVIQVRDITEPRRMQAALIATEQRFRHIVETAGEGIWVLDAENRTTFANLRMADMLGCTLAEMQGKSLFDFMDDEGRRIARDTVELRKHGIGGKHDFKFRRADGVDLWTMITATPLHDADGTYAGSLGMITDITERRLMESQLRESEARFRSLVDEMPVGVLLYGPDRRVVLVNPAARQMMGVPDKALIGQTTTSGAWDVVFEDGRPMPPEQGPSTVAFNTGRPVRGQVSGFRLPDTGEIRWLLNTAVPLRGKEGAIANVIVAIHDITDLKRIEQDLNDSRLRFQRTFDNALIGMAITAADGHFIEVNPAFCAMLGYSAEELGNKSFAEITHPDDIEISFAPLRRLLRNEIPSFQIEKRYLHRDGHVIWVLLCSVLVRDQEGRALHCLTQAQDITERRLAEEQLRHANAELDRASRLKSEFLATMTHEIRTPLSGVIGMTDLLFDTDLSPQQLEFTKTIRTSTEALLTIINDVLDLSKIEAGRLALEQTEFTLATILEDVTDMLGAKVRAKGIELATIMAPNLPTHVIGDAGRLRQVLLNIMSNAVKFTDHGEVVVRVTEEPAAPGASTLRFTVTDTGIGIAPEVQSTLFAPFTQADASTSRKYGGTGLGLAICKQLVALMGGTIGVDSTLGLGSTFWFTIQLAVATGHDADEPSLSPDLLRLRVLVVSQNATARMSVQSQLSSWHLASQAASNEAGAVQILQRARRIGEPVDLIILDRPMLGRDGLEMVRLLRASTTPAPQVVMLSSNMLDEFELRQAQIEAFLVKPVRASQLFNALVQIAAKAEAPEASPVTQQELPFARGSKGKRILVAEDNPVNQRVALWTLERLGYQAALANDGREALHLVQSEQFDLVLMDCQMPEMDGYETAREIRRREAGTGRHLPIVAMTANALEGEDQKCFEAGMDDYLAKPVKRDQLAVTLDRWLTSTARDTAE